MNHNYILNNFTTNFIHYHIATNGTYKTYTECMFCRVCNPKQLWLYRGKELFMRGKDISISEAYVYSTYQFKYKKQLQCYSRVMCFSCKKIEFSLWSKTQYNWIVNTICAMYSMLVRYGINYAREACLMQIY